MMRLPPRVEACSHRVQHPTMRYAVPEKLTPWGHMLLEALGVAVKPI
jgi:hypothetical protein